MKQQQQINPSNLQSRSSPLIARSQSHPTPQLQSQQQTIQPIYNPDECSAPNIIKEGSLHKPAVGLHPQVNPLAQTTQHQNQSVVKMAAEKMKRKFLGWN